jgi:hypothetical protein
MSYAGHPFMGADHSLHRRALQDRATLDDRLDTREGDDVEERVAVDGDDVGELAGLDGAKPILHGGRSIARKMPACNL